MLLGARGRLLPWDPGRGGLGREVSQTCSAELTLSPGRIRGCGENRKSRYFLELSFHVSGAVSKGTHNDLHHHHRPGSPPSVSVISPRWGRAGSLPSVSPSVSSTDHDTRNSSYGPFGSGSHHSWLADLVTFLLEAPGCCILASKLQCTWCYPPQLISVLVLFLFFLQDMWPFMLHALFLKPSLSVWFFVSL